MSGETKRGVVACPPDPQGGSKDDARESQGKLCPCEDRACPSRPNASSNSGLLSCFVLRRLEAFVQGNLYRSIALAELAAVAGISRFHFCRLFKRRTGLTPMAFVERLRIERAKQLMRDTRLGLAEVALLAGFADQSHFTHRFRRRVGVTPAAFARQAGQTMPMHARRIVSGPK